MKSSKTQNKTTSPTHPTTPFFNKTGEGSFFSQKKAQEADIPFFGPSHIQAKEGRIVKHKITSPDELRRDEIKDAKTQVRRPKMDDESFAKLMQKISDILFYAPSPPHYIDLPGNGPFPKMEGVPVYLQPGLKNIWSAANGMDENYRDISPLENIRYLKRGWRQIQPLLSYRERFEKDGSEAWSKKWGEWYDKNILAKYRDIIIASKKEIIMDARIEERRKARELEIEQSIKIVDGWKLLGQEKYKWGSQRVVRNFYVGTEEQWRKVLAKADDQDVYYKYVHPFLQLVENPNIVDGRTRNHMRSEYKSTVLRIPNNDEIMAFMRALYTHSNLDIRQSWSGGNIHHARITRSFAHIIKRYQAQVIREISLKGTTAGKRVLDEKAIRAIAEEGRGPSRINMIKSAIVSANEGLAKLILANAQKNEADKSNMYQLISNAGSLIRHTLNVHKEELKKQEQLNTLILDLVLDVTKLDEIPGVQTVLRRIPTIKTILKKNASNMLNAGSQSSSPYTQAYKIVAEFEETARKFGPTGNPNEVGKLLDANSERIAINTFKSSMSIK